MLPSIVLNIFVLIVCAVSVIGIPIGSFVFPYETNKFYIDFTGTVLHERPINGTKEMVIACTAFMALCTGL